jgi:hypothetical protein
MWAAVMTSIPDIRLYADIKAAATTRPQSIKVQELSRFHKSDLSSNPHGETRRWSPLRYAGMPGIDYLVDVVS